MERIEILQTWQLLLIGNCCKDHCCSSVSILLTYNCPNTSSPKKEICKFAMCIPVQKVQNSKLSMEPPLRTWCSLIFRDSKWHQTVVMGTQPFWQLFPCSQRPLLVSGRYRQNFHFSVIIHLTCNGCLCYFNNSKINKHLVAM